MINILLCGNKKVFDGALTELLSITNKTKETNKSDSLKFSLEPETSEDEPYGGLMKKYLHK